MMAPSGYTLVVEMLPSSFTCVSVAPRSMELSITRGKPRASVALSLATPSAEAMDATGVVALPLLIAGLVFQFRGSVYVRPP